MKRGLLLRLGALAGAANLVAAECPNACSGHGTCGAYDMCTCYTGYMANDCSERICAFGLAHVDSPKGDLDMDNDVDYSTVISGSQMYKYGTSELFPKMVEADETVAVLVNTAHYYMECSNKGLCDRLAGTCVCFIGYEGHSCERASCPNGCSGHGVCKTTRELADDHFANVYELWDADKTLSCECDPGYGTYDCSARMCPYGVDPLSIDDENTIRVPTWTLHFEDAVGIATAEGTWRLRFYDVYGEDWVTNPIALHASCADLVTELEALPNDAIDATSATCLLVSAVNIATYSLSFTGNPGSLRVPEIIILDESGRHTLKQAATSAAYTGLDNTVVYDKGITGEFYDYFNTKCNVVIGGITDVVTGPLASVQTVAISSGTEKALKSCLGDSNGVSTDNLDVENWDYGAFHDALLPLTLPGQFPHLVKLVNSAASSEVEGGVYAIMFWNPDDTTFYLSTTVDNTLEYQVFATDGILERVWYDSNQDMILDFSGDEFGTAHWEKYENIIYTSRDFSCENTANDVTNFVFYGGSSYLQNNCLQKGDLIVLPSSSYGTSTTAIMGDTGFAPTVTAALGDLNTAGLYEIMKISKEDYTANTNSTEDRFQIVLDRPVFWSGSETEYLLSGTPTKVGTRPFYRFIPDMHSNLQEVVAPCSSRGLCDELTGLCTCFAGYTNENCDTQSALAI